MTISNRTYKKTKTIFKCTNSNKKNTLNFYLYRNLKHDFQNVNDINMILKPADHSSMFDKFWGQNSSFSFFNLLHQNEQVHLKGEQLYHFCAPLHNLVNS